MPRTWASNVQTAMESGQLSVAWLLEMQTDELTLRTTNREIEITYNSAVYEPAYQGWEISGTLSTGSNLVPEPLTLTFDGADQYVEGTLLERLLDNTWSQRPMALTGLLLNIADRSVIGEFMRWLGRMDTIDFTEHTGSKAIAVMTCEGGPFRVLGRNMSTVSHADQLRRNPTDMFFKNQASKVGSRMPFGVKQVNIPGTNVTTMTGRPGANFGNLV